MRARLHRRWAAVPSPVRTFVGWLRSPEFVTTSASLAFYSMISLPPMVLLGFWIAGWFVDDTALQQLGQQVDSQAPDQLPVADILRALIDVAGQTGWLAAVAAIWPATTYGAALARAFSAIAPDADRRIRGWRGRLLALVVIGALPFAVFSAVLALYLLPQLASSSGASRAALGAGALLVLWLMVALIYQLFEVRETRWHDVLVGAGLATILVAVATTGYLLYLNVADFTQRYGPTALATAVLLGLWLLLANAALIVGYRIMLRRVLHRLHPGTRRAVSAGSATAGGS